MLTLIATFSVGLVGCGGDDEKDEPKVPGTGQTTDLLSGTLWEIVDDGLNGELAGSIIKFENDGNLMITPDIPNLDHSNWQLDGDKLTIRLNYGGPDDDYMIGTITFVGNKAVYSYQYLEEYHVEAGNYVMTLKKLDNNYEPGENSERIIGAWQCDRSNMYSYWIDFENSIWEFYDDGSLYIEITETVIYDHSWSISGNQLTIYMTYGTPPVENSMTGTITFTGNTAVYKYKYNGDSMYEGRTYTMTFKKLY